MLLVKAMLYEGPHDGLIVDLTAALPEIRLPAYGQLEACINTGLNNQLSPAIRCSVYRRWSWDLREQRWCYHYAGTA